MKRMFRVAVAYSVAVEAETDSEAVEMARYSSPSNGRTIRKLSMMVVGSWLDKSQAVESVHNAAAGEQSFKDSNSSTYRDPAAKEDFPF